MIDRRCGTELGSEAESVKVTIKGGHMLIGGERVSLEYPEGEIKYYQVDPFQKEICLFLSNSRKWTFAFVTLNDFLTWKNHLAISMRPALLNSKKCQNCDRSLFISSSYNCHFCGQKLCSFCSRFVAQLNFLGYTNSVRICESCIEPINRIKTEEVESFVKRAETGSFMRNSSIYEVVPELLD